MVEDVNKNHDALVEVFECVEIFLNRLEIVTNIPLTQEMTEIFIKIMLELLSVFALATKQVKEGRLGKSTSANNHLQVLT